MANHSRWLDLIDWLKAHSAGMPTDWPPELPPEAMPGFWTLVQRVEAEQRPALSAKIRRWLEQPEREPWTPLEHWFLLRRIEFAVGVAALKARERIEPAEPLPELLLLLLIEMWEAHGVNLLALQARLQPPQH